MGGFFDEQTVGGQRKEGPTPISVLLGARKGTGEEEEEEEEEEEDEVGVEAVKPEMEKARMADDDARRAAEGERDGRKEGRTRGRPLLTFPANVSRHENDLAAAAVSAPRSRLSPLLAAPQRAKKQIVNGAQP